MRIKRTMRREPCVVNRILCVVNRDHLYRTMSHMGDLPPCFLPCEMVRFFWFFVLFNEYDAHFYGAFNCIVVEINVNVTI